MPAFDFKPKNYPNDPGCYLMKDAAGKVMYVGKAKNLRKRVSSYFNKGRKRRYILNMVRRIRDIEVMIVNNETESLILETNLIRRYRPGTNRAKMGLTSGYPYIVLTDEIYPRFVPFRKYRVNRDLGDEGIAIADRRFGPYLNSQIRDTLLEFVNDNFRIRTCHPMPKSVCLSYHLGTCGGICERRVADEAYQAQVTEAVRFLSLKHTRVIREMREQMMECAERELFIRAGKIRDQLAAVGSIMERQIVERDVDYDQDVIYFGHGHAASQCSGSRYALVMTIKQGMIWEMQLESLKGWVEESTPAENADCHFLRQRYAHNAPKELITNLDGDLISIAAELSKQNGHRVKITNPCRGVKVHLLGLGQRNFEYRAWGGSKLG